MKFASWFADVGIPDAKEKKPKRHLALGNEAHRQWLRAVYHARQKADKRLALETGQKVDKSLALQADYILCCLMWGGRATETATLKIEDVHTGVAEDEYFGARLPYAVFNDTKNSLMHFFPLTPLACDILRERIVKSLADEDNHDGWVFPSRERDDDGKKKPITGWGCRRLLDTVQEETGVYIRPHDLRRTLAGELFGDTNQNKYLVSVALNHASGVTGDYIEASARPKIEGLRKPFEVRERRLKRVLGLVADTRKITAAARLEILDPANRDEVLELLGITA